MNEDRGKDVWDLVHRHQRKIHIYRSASGRAWNSYLYRRGVLFLVHLFMDLQIVREVRSMDPPP
jgi:hypothetical protein